MDKQKENVIRETSRGEEKKWKRKTKQGNRDNKHTHNVPG